MKRVKILIGLLGFAMILSASASSEAHGRRGYYVPAGHYYPNGHGHHRGYRNNNYYYYPARGVYVDRFVRGIYSYPYYGGYYPYPSCHDSSGFGFSVHVGR